MLPQLSRLKGLACDLLFPRWCIGCGKEGDFLCPACRRALPFIIPPLCPRCGLPQDSVEPCTGCAVWPWAIDGIRSPFRFEGTVRLAIHQLKYNQLRAIAALFACFLDDYLGDNPLPGEVLVPVPLHRRRLRERGYNQSALLARELGNRNGMPVLEGCLRRQKHSLPQARTLSLGERRDNVADAFGCADDSLRGRQVLLIDDVATSGATLDACARAVKEAGAASIWGLTLAREL